MEIHQLGQVIIACLLGGILGFQRMYRGKAAGARTYALVSAGSALFTILSINAFSPSDPSSVAAPIVFGIGFIGAGAILHRPDHIEGLTTAAALWIAAAVGMAVGVGYYELAAGTTIIMLAVLMFDERRLNFEEEIIKSKKKKKTASR